MTRVIGKQPLELTGFPKVSTTWDDKIRITTWGYTGSKEFQAVGELETGCAATLIVELRRALRKIRAERIEALNACVSDAEKVLP